MRGRLITIEGIDGSGKGTQASLLVERLVAAGESAKLFSFPSYEQTFFGSEIGAYLRGEFGTLEQVHPKIASMLFAGDRFERSKEIQELIDANVTVVCDRYADSNIAHQCSRLPTAAEQQAMQKWLQTLEFEVFGIPRPDVTFFLKLPIEHTRRLVLEKDERSYTADKEDIHEANHEYLIGVASFYQQLSDEQNWIEVDCIQGKTLRSIDDVNQELLEHLRSS